MRRKKTTDQYADEKRWVFSSDFKKKKKESENECLIHDVKGMVRSAFGAMSIWDFE